MNMAFRDEIEGDGRWLDRPESTTTCVAFLSDTSGWGEHLVFQIVDPIRKSGRSCLMLVVMPTAIFLAEATVSGNSPLGKFLYLLNAYCMPARRGRGLRRGRNPLLENGE